MKTTIRITGPQGCGKTTIFEKIEALLEAEGYEMETGSFPEDVTAKKEDFEINLITQQETDSYSSTMSEVKFSPKLKTAMREITAVIIKHDVAAIVVLHTPNHSEYLLRLDPTYSCARFDGNKLHVKSNLMKNFHGDRGKWQKQLGNTANMFEMLTKTNGTVLMGLMPISEKVSEEFNAIHNKPIHTLHIEKGKDQVN
jgi:energy-coupling factor transporter ATP-binding protein EcfA2